MRKDDRCMYLDVLWGLLTSGECPDRVLCDGESFDARKIDLLMVRNIMRTGAVTITFEKLRTLLRDEDKSEYIEIFRGSAKAIMERLKMGAAGSYNPTTSRWAAHLPRDHKIEIVPTGVVALFRKRST